MFGNSFRAMKFATSVVVAFAGLILAPAPATAQPYDWSGPYLGGHVGQAWMDVDTVYDTADAAAPFDFSPLDLDGVIAGGQVGFNFQVDQILFGIEADASTGNSDTLATTEPPTRGPDIVDVDLDFLASVRGRLGWVLDGVPGGSSLLIFGTAGIAFTEYDLSIFNEFDDTTGKLSFDEIGAVFGGGVEIATIHGFNLRLEYLFYDVGESAAITPPRFSDADPGDNISFDDVHVVRASVIIPF